MIMRPLACLLICAAALPAQHGSITGNPFSTPRDRELGEQSFRSQCAACHGLDGAGGAAGPDLSSGVFKRGSSDDALFQVIQKGVPGTPMTGFNLAGREVWQLITYLRFLGIGKAAEKATGNVAAGEKIFAVQGCAGCHTVGYTGGLRGPDLSEVGSRRSLAQMASSIMDPSGEVLPDYWSLNLRTKSGETITGARLNEDMDSFQLLDSSGKLRSVWKADLAKAETVRLSAMPSYKGKLSAAELDDLIAYLASLRAPTPEAAE
jgi:cytochrome c oxidase cbb3-type subunit III